VQTTSSAAAVTSSLAASSEKTEASSEKTTEKTVSSTAQVTSAEATAAQSTTAPSASTTSSTGAPVTTAESVTTVTTTAAMPTTVPTTQPVTSQTGGPQPVCSILIECSTILDNMDRLTKGKEVLVPSDGIILEIEYVPISEGETAFSVLQRVLTERNMHIEFMNSPMYDTVYVEGICNLYEFDCGELSGWIYSVNGKIYSYGSGDFTVSPGDRIVWSYTCELGADLEAER